MAKGSVPVDLLQDGIGHDARQVGFIGFILGGRNIDNFDVFEACLFWGASHLVGGASTQQKGKEG